MKRIIVIGCPGSGKSYLSKRIHEATGIPLFHLDNIWWKDDSNHISRDEFDEILTAVMNTESWIIDGDYSRTMERRMNECDTVIFLDYSLAQCLSGIRERENVARDDCPILTVNQQLIDEVEKYRLEKRPAVMQLLEKYSDKDILVFNERSQAENWLKNIK